MKTSSVERRVVRHAQSVKAEVDRIAVEEPLEIRVAGDALAITMRTPGEDAQLAVGFLFAEGVIESIADVGSAVHCGRPGEDGYGNVIDVIPGPGARVDPSRLEGSRRGTLTTTACGVCGRKSIDDLLERIGAVDTDVRVDLALIRRAPEILKESQPGFRRTGALHGAAALDRNGSILAACEDVGRHNAVDKAIGRLLYDARLGEAVVLVVSGRVSFEIVQKAAAARIPIVAAVSAPTSLAIDLADRAGITLAAFVREGRVNVYTHAERLQSSSSSSSSS